MAKVELVSTLLFNECMVNFTHFCQTCYQVYTHHIDDFAESDLMSNTMKNEFEKFLQELFFQGCRWVISSPPCRQVTVTTNCIAVSSLKLCYFRYSINLSMFFGVWLVRIHHWPQIKQIHCGDVKWPSWWLKILAENASIWWRHNETHKIA